MKSSVTLLLVGAVSLCLVANVGTARLVTNYSLPSGTSVITVDGGTFTVNTSAPIVLEIGFEGTIAVVGDVAVDGSPQASVGIVWEETGLTVFSAVVQTSQSFRYAIPPEHQAAVDIGHTEK
jgi:hypothetical protein